MTDWQYRTRVSALLALAIAAGPMPSVPPAEAQAQSVPTSKQVTETDLFNELKKLNAVTDQDERMKMLLHLVEDRPDLVRVDGGGANIAFMARPYIKANSGDEKKLEAWHDIFVPLVQKTLSGEDYAISEFDYRLAGFLLDNHVLLSQSAQLAAQAVQSFHEDDVVARQRQLHGAQQASESTFRSDASEHFHRDLSARYSLLARLQMETGQDKAALGSFDKALKLHPDMQAYMGEAALQEKQGDKERALALLEDAYLTGHMAAADIEHMRSLYRALHPGNGDAQLESMLDAKYNATFNNPVKFTIYKPETASSSRTVLAEFFTGAGCEPCMSPDLAFDAALQRYSRKELVLLVHHDNAPAPDPLANSVTDDRNKYYATGGGTPHVFLDGKATRLAEGLPSHAQQSADDLYANVEKELAVATNASVKVNAIRHGDRIDVTAHVQVPANSKGRKLHIDLIEKEISYSGENTLRIHPMVVRATAQSTESASGFNIPASGVLDVQYTFDLPKIEATNTAYYDSYIESLTKRSNGMLSVGYREKRAVINPEKLAVAAFVQIDDDKQVLQATFSDVRERNAIARDGR